MLGDSIQYCDEVHIWRGRLGQNLGVYLHHTKPLDRLFYNTELVKGFGQERTHSYESFSPLICKIKEIKLLFSFPSSSVIYQCNWVVILSNKIGKRKRERVWMRNLDVLIAFIGYHIVLSNRENLTAIWNNQEVERENSVSGSFSFLYLR